MALEPHYPVKEQGNVSFPELCWLYLITQALKQPCLCPGFPHVPRENASFCLACSPSLWRTSLVCHLYHPFLRRASLLCP